jgi:hypothetical protein
VISGFLALAAEGATPAPVPVPVPEPEPVTPKSASSFDSFFAAESAAAAPTPIKAPTPAPAAAAPAKAAAPAGLLDLATSSGKAGDGISGAFAAYATLKRSITAPVASIDAFIAGISTKPKPVAAPVAAPAPIAAPRPAAAPIAAVTPARAPVAPVAPVATSASADGVVDIRDLCYSGAGALARALEVRKELIEVLANPMRAGGRMRPLLDELLDLIEMAQRS